tara:strand:- start:93 stop:326 length:234 start_codon:yes stop_codon:yes gene_type:complete
MSLHKYTDAALARAREAAASANPTDSRGQAISIIECAAAICYELAALREVVGGGTADEVADSIVAAYESVRGDHHDG